MERMKITYLEHSGFMCETENNIVIFDYHQDPKAKVEEMIKQSQKKIYFFVSHNHWDHFNPHINQFENRVNRYIIHEDCDLILQNKNKMMRMKPGDKQYIDDIEVIMYDSTDVGGSFYVTVDNHTIFHAGDLNWWHWAGESDEENRMASESYFKKIEEIKEKNVEIAFFPVDARQEMAREWGVRNFLERMNVTGLLVPMHANGRKWIPSYEFRFRFPHVNIWIPTEYGEEKEGL